MILATQKLIEYYKTAKYRDLTIVWAYVHTIIRYGNVSDADVLLDVFLDDPTDHCHENLLDVVAALGGVKHAELIYKDCFESNLLKPNICDDVLHALGYLNYEPAKDALLYYALANGDKINHSTNKSAVLGLLHLDCSDSEDKIKQAIESTYGKGLFHEFIPALACKLSDQEEILEQLYRFGSTVVSTDCNGGIVLGFSLCGDSGRKYFNKILWNDHWELYAVGTGSHYWAYVGMQNLGISFQELYAEIKAMQTENLEYKIRVVHDLLRTKINFRGLYPLRFIKPREESFQSIYENLFAWETPNLANNIREVVQDSDLSEDIFQLENILINRIEEEIKENNQKMIEE